MQGRGSRGPRWPALTPALRAVALLLALAVATQAVRLLVTPPLSALAELHSGGQPWGLLPLAPFVAGGCAAALAACWAWLVTCAVVVAVSTLRDVLGAGVAAHGTTSTPAGVAAGRSRLCPRLVRTLVLAALGVAVATGPASADSPGTSDSRPSRDLTRGVVGLPVPDRVATPVAPRVAAAASTQVPAATTGRVTVQPGDSLWAIAQRHLPPGAPDAAVQAGWRLLADANADRIGHPDLIFPGTVLRVPPLDGTHLSTH